MSDCTDDRLCTRRGEETLTLREGGREVRGHLEGEGLVLWKLNKENRSKVVTCQSCGLRVQAARVEGANQITDTLSLHTHFRRQYIVPYLREREREGEGEGEGERERRVMCGLNKEANSTSRVRGRSFIPLLCRSEGSELRNSRTSTITYRETHAQLSSFTLTPPYLLLHSLASSPARVGVVRSVSNHTLLVHRENHML